VTVKELKRWLASQGCTFSEGTNHMWVFRHGRRTQLPRHWTAQVKEKTLKTILAALDLDHPKFLKQKGKE
jgi:mRNA interferase HicA